MADVNGYTALYECRAGNTQDSQTNVDVATYVAHAVTETITTADSIATIDSKLNSGAQYIAIENGDYTSKGTITITSSGTSGARKVLRYTRASDSDDEPWNQSSANQVKLRDLVFSGADYWIVHRISFTASSAAATPGDYRMDFTGTSTDNIISRCLVEGNSSIPSGANHLYGGIGSSAGGMADRLTIQNSVIRTNYPAGTGYNSAGVLPEGTDVRFVNCELYDWAEHNLQIGENSTPDLPGMIVENCDIYYTTGFSGYSESNISTKASGTSANPLRYIHNRIWGTRWGTATSEGGGGAGLEIFGTGTGAEVDYVLIQNNIIMDNIYGITGFPGEGTNISVIGNIVYKHHQFTGPSNDSTAINISYLGANTEVYLNTVIDSDGFLTHGNTNSDVRGNVAISAGTTTGTPGSGAQQNYNAYYGTTDNSEANKIGNLALNTRANSTLYTSGQIMRTVATPPETGAVGDFLHICTTTGTSAGSSPAFSAVLGSSTTDGTAVWRAIRGPYSFYRKLKTSPELVYIPYARAHAGASEATLCPSGFASRSGIGIDNTQP